MPIKESKHYLFRVRLLQGDTCREEKQNAKNLGLSVKIISIFFFVTHASILASETIIKRKRLTFLKKCVQEILLPFFLHQKKVLFFRKHVKPLYIFGAKKLDQ